MKDFFLLASRGSIAGVKTVNKFGRAPDGVQTTSTDIWARADAVPTQQIWTAPTQARQHNIVSTSTSDDGSPVGVGARTVEIYGLQDWDTAETSEIITMNGTTNVLTTNSYVIIHRMKVRTWGATSVNVGVITATAVTDSTVTAQIQASFGQTQLAIYGIPSVQDFYMGRMYANLLKTGGSGSSVDVRLMINDNVSNQLTNFRTEHTFGITKDGGTNTQVNFYTPKKITGPAIVKINGIGSVADLDVSAGFDGILVDK